MSKMLAAAKEAGKVKPGEVKHGEVK